MKREPFAIGDHGVPGVGATLVANDIVRIARKIIDYLCLEYSLKLEPRRRAPPVTGIKCLQA